jgi:hypothetical protein
VPASEKTERRREWNFTITDEGWGWTLRYPDGRLEHSERAFGSLKEAGDDAMAHGYGAWKFAERRRAETEMEDFA